MSALFRLLFIAAVALAGAPAMAQYDAVRVVQPADGETVWDPGDGTLEVEIEVTPPLRTAEGHRIRAVLDGQALEGEYATPHFRLEGFTRDTYSLRAAVVDRSGRVLAASESVTVYYKKHSRLAPSGPGIYPSPSPPARGKP